jgi:Cu-Zn family superoxide dismutase
MRTNHITRATGIALAGLALVVPVALAQDATPMASPIASPVASPIGGAGMTLDVPLVNAAGDAVGLATFTEGDDGVTIRVLAEGLTPGEHGWHLHQFGNCDGATTEPFSSAGEHWNPTDMEHGAPDADPHHAGDFGNFDATADGLVEATITTSDFTLGEGPTSVFDEDGTAIILHADRDDLTTQPGGDSGARVACGVVAEPMMGAMGTPMATPMGAMGTPVATPMGAMSTPMATPMTGMATPEATPISDMATPAATPMSGMATPEATPQS